MADSGTSDCFTHSQSTLTEYTALDDDELIVASETNSLKIKGKGAWIIMHEVLQTLFLL